MSRPAGLNSKETGGVLQNKNMKLIYALAKGETRRYMESLIATKAQTPEQIQAVKTAAMKDGFHSFRIAEHQDAQSGEELAGMFRNLK